MHDFSIMLVKDLQLVILCFAVLMLAMGANIVLSLYYHIEITKEAFDKRKICYTAKKALMLMLGTILMVIAIDSAGTLLAPYLPDVFGKMQDTVTMAMIISTIGVAVCRYIKDAYRSFLDILKATIPMEDNEVNAKDK